ncbi:MAG: hypothetical protein Q8P18_15305 [Pseudomonadota bacterium]|nr:hypothetical protein [Pseudomonadota bacterium]
MDLPLALPTLMQPPFVAICAALVYGLVSWRVGERFPFSRYAMYADLEDRREGAVLVVHADGREVEFQDVTAWYGITPEAIEPFSVPCSLHWVVFEAQRWIRDRTAASPDGLTVRVEVGYRIFRVTPEGDVVERIAPRASGLGRLRA